MSDSKVVNAPPVPDRPAVSFRQVLENKRFLALFAANFVSSFGDWLALIGLLNLVAFRSRGNPFQVSSIFVAFVIPVVILGPFAGVLVDRWNLKRTMIASDLLRAVLAVMLALITETVQIYPIIFALSAASTFFIPAQTSTIPRLVSKEQLLTANSLNSQSVNLNRIIGPAVAGMLVAWGGEKLCFYLDAITFVFSACMLSLVVIPQSGKDEARAEKKTIIKELIRGMRFIFGHQALLFVFGSMTIAILALGAVDALFAVYVRDILFAHAKTFGGALSLVGAATILGAWLIGKYGHSISKLHLVVFGIGAFSAGVFIIAVSGNLWVMLCCCIVLGLGVSAVMIPSQTLIQQETPPEMLGRVSSSLMSLMTLAQLIAFLSAGGIAGRIGIVNLYYLTAAMLGMIALWGIIRLRNKSVLWETERR